VTRRRDLWALAGVVVLVESVAVRLVNAVAYPPLFGFDAIANWRYIDGLTKDWTLPAPDADWSTAHPPLFYYLAALLVRAARGLCGAEAVGEAAGAVMVRLAVSTVGVAAALWAARAVAQREGGSRRETLVLGALLLVPAHVMLSAMVSEEVLAASLSTVALVLALRALDGADAGTADRRALACGAVAGLAALTKLSGALVVPAAVLAFAAQGLPGAVPGAARRGLRRAALCALAAGLVGGWYYLRNLALYGYFYPQSLSTHAVMLAMPPGERGLADYLWLPLATWTRNSVIDPALLHSVWGGTFATLWFDGHRKFLPLADERVRLAGTAVLALALVPTAAFAAGFVRGLGRALRARSSRDLLLCAHLGLTLAGYALFSWRNPWFATIKGSFLLGTGLPAALYSAQEFERWLARGPRLRRVLLVWAVVWALAVGLVFTWGLVFAKQDFAGVKWTPQLPR